MTTTAAAALAAVEAATAELEAAVAEAGRLARVPDAAPEWVSAARRVYELAAAKNAAQAAYAAALQAEAAHTGRPINLTR